MSVPPVRLSALKRCKPCDETREITCKRAPSLLARNQTRENNLPPVTESVASKVMSIGSSGASFAVEVEGSNKQTISNSPHLRAACRNTVVPAVKTGKITGPFSPTLPKHS